MTWFSMPRVPEPEVMDAASEVEAYASAAAQSYLETIDRTFVEHAARLLEPANRGGPPGEPVSGLALDLGCGPGQIPILMAQRWPGLRITGVDAATHMIEEARRAAARAAVAISFQVVQAGSGAQGRLPFADACFDLVTCNSVLHHLSDPVAVLDEIGRVAKPAGAVLVRDLRRPSALSHGLHWRWFGRHYSGEMLRLYRASVRAAYTLDELAEMLRRSRLNDGRARVFRHRRTHIGIERPPA